MPIVSSNLTVKSAKVSTPPPYEISSGGANAETLGGVRPRSFEDRELNWLSFVRQAQSQRRIADLVGRIAEAIWQRLRHAQSVNPPVPDAMVNEEGSLLMVWSDGSVHFQIRVTPAGVSEWYFLNRETGEDDDGDVKIESASPLKFSMPAKMLEYFSAVA